MQADYEVTEISEGDLEAIQEVKLMLQTSEKDARKREAELRKKEVEVRSKLRSLGYTEVHIDFLVDSALDRRESSAAKAAQALKEQSRVRFLSNAQKLLLVASLATGVAAAYVMSRVWG
ncbi:MAG: hypothetical protein JW834_01500 [Candidatus Diapherotrites archaeon]|nr:hypothetical protein [Candidatus Diapherotrites archaeon]